MPISLQCPGCGKGYALADELAGKRVKCRCGTVMTVPAPAAPEREPGREDTDPTSSATEGPPRRPSRRDQGGGKWRVVIGVLSVVYGTAMVPVILTLYAGEEDYKFRVAQKQKQGITALRRQQIARMAQEALDQGALLTAEDFAFRIFNAASKASRRAARLPASIAFRAMPDKYPIQRAFSNVPASVSFRTASTCSSMSASTSLALCSRNSAGSWV